MSTGNQPPTATALQVQVDALAKMAETSTDICVIAQTIALRDQNVFDLFVSKLAARFVYRGSFCVPRKDGYTTVVFNFEIDYVSQPQIFSLVKPWFSAVVDVELRRVVGTQDPYVPSVVASTSGCGCGSAPNFFSNNCDDVKNDLMSRGFSHVGFGQCDHPLTASADTEAATLQAAYLVQNPRCSRDTEAGHRTVTNSGPFGSSYNTYLAYFACNDI